MGVAPTLVGICKEGAKTQSLFLNTKEADFLKETDLSDLSEINRSNNTALAIQINQINPLPYIFAIYLEINQRNPLPLFS